MDSWQQRFLTCLADTGNVSAAARHAGRPRSVVYDCRRRDAAFGAAWADALEEAADRLELEALRRAVDGVDEDKFYQGEVVGQITRYSDNLLMFLLRARRPAQFNSHKMGQMEGRRQGEAEDEADADAEGDVQIISRLRRRMKSLRAPRLAGFQRMRDAIACGDWQLAASEALDSRWAVQTGRRAHHIAGMLRGGEISG